MCVWVAASRIFWGGIPVFLPANERTCEVSSSGNPIKSQNTMAALQPSWLSTIALAIKGSWVPVPSRSWKYPLMRY